MKNRVKSILAAIIVVTAIMVIFPAVALATNGSSFDLSEKDNGSITVYHISSSSMRVGVMTNGSENFFNYESGSRTSITLPANGGEVTVTIYGQVEGTTYAILDKVSFTVASTENAAAVKTIASFTTVKDMPLATTAAAANTTTAVSTANMVAVEIPAAYNRYLTSANEINFNMGDAISTKAAELTAGKATTQERAMAIYSFIAKNFSYDWDLYNAVVSGRVKTYTPNPNSILASRKGICYDISSLYSAMCRSVGIPTKLVKGNSKPAGGYHAWNSVFDAELNSWVSLDITLSLGKSVSSTSYKTIGSGYSVSSEI